MVDIFDEVEEDFRAERTRALLLRFGVLLGGLALIAAIGVGGWQFWRYRQARDQLGVAAVYMGAAEKAATAPQAALADFSRVAAEGNEGYRTLARLRAAALQADAGALPAALALWDQIAGDAAADPALRDLASLLWVERQVDTGDPAVLTARLQPLTAGDSLWRALALEDQALIQIRTGATGPARDTLRRVANDATAPEGVRGRANNLLARLGG